MRGLTVGEIKEELDGYEDDVRLVVVVETDHGPREYEVDLVTTRVYPGEQPVVTVVAS